MVKCSRCEGMGYLANIHDRCPECGGLGGKTADSYQVTAVNGAGPVSETAARPAYDGPTTVAYMAQFERTMEHTPILDCSLAKEDPHPLHLLIATLQDSIRDLRARVDLLQAEVERNRKSRSKTSRPSKWKLP